MRNAMTREHLQMLLVVYRCQQRPIAELKSLRHYKQTKHAHIELIGHRVYTRFIGGESYTWGVGNLLSLWIRTISQIELFAVFLPHYPIYILVLVGVLFFRWYNLERLTSSYNVIGVILDSGYGDRCGGIKGNVANRRDVTHNLITGVCSCCPAQRKIIQKRLKFHLNVFVCYVCVHGVQRI